MRTVLAMTMLAVTACGAPSHHTSSPPPFGVIDQPSAGAHVPATFLTRGWALGVEPVIEVTAIVDGTTETRITSRALRPDVAAAFPNYSAGRARPGWAGEIALPPATAAGAHSLVVRLRDAAGASRDLGPVAFVIDRPAPPAIAERIRGGSPVVSSDFPSGSVDHPQEGANVGRSFSSSGSALGHDEIKEVRVFVDGAYLMSAYPRQAAGARDAHWSTQTTLPAALPAGRHSMAYQAVDARGVMRVIGVVGIVVADK